MKDTYIESLAKALYEYEIPEKDVVLNKYIKRYEFGLESGLSEEEIEKMLGDPSEICKKLASEFKDTKEADEIKGASKNFNLIIKTVSDDIIVKRSEDSIIHTFLESTDTSAYDLKNNDKNGVLMKYKTGSYFNLNRKNGRLIVEIPEGTTFDEIDLATNHGNISIETNLSANDISISSSTGDLNHFKLSAESVYIHASQAKVKGHQITAKKTKIVTVSGDVSIVEVKGDVISIETISGDVKIDETNAKYKVTSVTGKVDVGGKKIKSIAKKIKGVFVNES